MVKGSFVDFISVVRALVPDIHKVIFSFSWTILIHELLKLVPAFILKILIDKIALHPTFMELLPLLIGMFLTLILMLCVEMYSTNKVVLAANGTQREILETTFKKLAEMPLEYHEKHNTGAQISKITKAANHINGLLWFLHNDILPTLIQISVTTVVLFFIDWRIGLLLVLFLPFVFKSIDKEFTMVQPIRSQYQKCLEDATRELAQTLINIQTVKSYGKEQYESKVHENILSKYIDFAAQRSRLERPVWFMRDTLTYVLRVSAIGLSVYFLVQGSLTVGALVLVITLIEKAFTNLFRIGRIYHFMGDTYEGLERLAGIYAEPITLISGNKKPINGDIVLKDLTFKYGDARPVFNNINLTITKGKVVALVGRSGSGKTTIAKLLTRQHDVTSGSITFGGIPLKELQLQELRRSVLYVSQLTEIFDRTVHENIAYANQNATREEVISAAKQASAHEFIMQLPNGYDTLVGERGVRLSGGQRQRVAIARAILADPHVIIFDEATSSLDTENEQAIQEAVFSIKGKTLIIIAHRLSTIKHADTVVVLEEGKIIETGSHADLLKHKGVYHKMIELQKLGELRD